MKLVQDPRDSLDPMSRALLEIIEARTTPPSVQRPKNAHRSNLASACLGREDMRGLLAERGFKVSLTTVSKCYRGLLQWERSLFSLDGWSDDWNKAIGDLYSLLARFSTAECDEVSHALTNVLDGAKKLVLTHAASIGVTPSRLPGDFLTPTQDKPPTPKLTIVRDGGDQ